MRLKICACKKDGDCFFCSGLTVYHVSEKDMQIDKSGGTKTVCAKCGFLGCSGYFNEKNEWICAPVIRGNTGIGKPNLGFKPRSHWLYQRIEHLAGVIEEFNLEKLLDSKDEILVLDKILNEMSFTLELLRNYSVFNKENINEETK